MSRLKPRPKSAGDVPSNWARIPDCAICLEPIFRDERAVPCCSDTADKCVNTFHEKCMNRWLTDQSGRVGSCTCPVCVRNCSKSPSCVPPVCKICLKKILPSEWASTPDCCNIKFHKKCIRGYVILNGPHSKCPSCGTEFNDAFYDSLMSQFDFISVDAVCDKNMEISIVEVVKREDGRNYRVDESWLWLPALRKRLWLTGKCDLQICYPNIRTPTLVMNVYGPGVLVRDRGRDTIHTFPDPNTRYSEIVKLLSKLRKVAPPDRSLLRRTCDAFSCKNVGNNPLQKAFEYFGDLCGLRARQPSVVGGRAVRHAARKRRV